MDEWAGLWQKGVFKRWSRSDLLPDDRVFTSKYVYKIKRSASTGEAYRFKARMIVRGFEMEKGVDYVDNFLKSRYARITFKNAELQLLLFTGVRVSSF